MSPNITSTPEVKISPWSVLVSVTVIWDPVSDELVILSFDPAAKIPRSLTVKSFWRSKVPFPPISKSAAASPKVPEPDTTIVPVVIVVLPV